MSSHKEIRRYLEDRPIQEMKHNDLNPLLQQLGRNEVKVKHGDWLRRDPLRAKRVSRAIITGGWPLSDSEIVAFEILGEDHFTVAEESCRSFSLMPSYWEAKAVPYSEETLKKCALENRTGEDWRIVFVNDLDPMTIYSSLNGDSFFWAAVHGEKQGQRADIVFEAWQAAHVPVGQGGYRLINFHAGFDEGSLSWSDQIKLVCRSGYVVAPAHFVLEAWCSQRIRTGKNGLHETESGVIYEGDHHVALGGSEQNPENLLYLCGFCVDSLHRFLVQYMPMRQKLIGGVMVMKEPEVKV